MFKQKVQLHSILQSLKNLEDLHLLRIGQNRRFGIPRFTSPVSANFPCMWQTRTGKMLITFFFLLKEKLDQTTHYHSICLHCIRKIAHLPHHSWYQLLSTWYDNAMWPGAGSEGSGRTGILLSMTWIRCLKQVYPFYPGAVFMGLEIYAFTKTKPNKKRNTNTKYNYKYKMESRVLKGAPVSEEA